MAQIFNWNLLKAIGSIIADNQSRQQTHVILLNPFLADLCDYFKNVDKDFNPRRFLEYISIEGVGIEVNHILGEEE